MLKYADTLSPNEIIECDICIVGSGAAGITLGRELIDSGLEVAILESSRWDHAFGVTHEHFEERLRSETTLTADHRAEDPVAQELYRGKVNEEMHVIDEHFLTRSRIRVYGGTTNCWGGWTRTLDDFDFDRSDLSPDYRWPISRSDLDDGYRLAVGYCSLVPGLADPSLYDRPAWWTEPGRTTPPVASINLPNGMRTMPFTAMNPSRLDFQTVWGPSIERSTNVTIWRNANARKLVMTGSAVTELQAQTIKSFPPPPPGEPGIPFRVHAKRYVLAMGGIETVRLLLLSDSIPNRYGQLGHYFMVHPVQNSAAQFNPTANVSAAQVRWYSQWVALLTNPQSPWPPICFAAIGADLGVLRSNGIGNFRSLVGLTTGSFNLNWEQLPNYDSWIELDPSYRDVFGDPRVKLHWHMTPRDTHTATRAIALTLQALQDSGYSYGYDWTNPRIGIPGDHHMGATRMSDSPQTGFVDRNCRVHEVDNLWISSCSVFRTGGIANPTLTIVAFAARLANELAPRAAKVTEPEPAAVR